MTIYGLRMRLARAIAPTTIMPDPFPKAEALVVYRKDGVRAVFRLDKMKLRTSRRLPSYEELEAAGPYAYVPRKTVTRFVGVSES